MDRDAVKHSVALSFQPFENGDVESWQMRATYVPCAFTSLRFCVLTIGSCTFRSSIYLRE